MDKISVIVCCFNTADTLDRCFDSLKNQTYGIDNLECIFVDDASSDKGATLTKLQEFERQYPENVIIVHCNENGKLGTASNIGLSYATGKYLQFLDADDELVTNAISDLHDMAERMNSDIIQYCHTLIMNGKRQINPPIKTGLFEIVTPNQRRPFLNSTLVTYGRTNKFFKLEFVKGVDSHFAEHMIYEEPKFVYPLFLYAERVYITASSYYLYYLHENSIVTSQLGMRILDHPNVQLQLLQDCMKRYDKFIENRDVIELYFLWTFYCETIYFASENPDACLPLEYFKYMQKVCRQLFPNWKNNPQIQELGDGIMKLLQSIENQFFSQNELDNYIKRIVKEY